MAARRGGPTALLAGGGPVTNALAVAAERLYRQWCGLPAVNPDDYNDTRALLHGAWLNMAREVIEKPDPRSWRYPLKSQFPIPRGGTPDKVRQVFWLAVRHGMACAYCRTPICICVATLDHIEPRSAGGSNAWWNLAIACMSCNSSKGAQPVDVFLAGRASAPPPISLLRSALRKEA